MPFNPRFQGTYFVRTLIQATKDESSKELSIPVFRGLILLELLISYGRNWWYYLSIPVFRGLILLGIHHITITKKYISFQSPFSGDLFC